MKTQNEHVSIEGMFGLYVDVINVRTYDIKMIRDIAWKHGCKTVASGHRSLSATFTWEDDAERFAAEVVAYTDQQAWLESIDEDEAKQYAIVFE